MHLHFERARTPALRCVDCGQIIGVYEAAVAVLEDEDEPQLVSRAGDPETFARSAERYHRGCFS